MCLSPVAAQYLSEPGFNAELMEDVLAVELTAGETARQLAQTDWTVGFLLCNTPYPSLGVHAHVGKQ